MYSIPNVESPIRSILVVFKLWSAAATANPAVVYVPLSMSAEYWGKLSAGVGGPIIFVQSRSTNSFMKEAVSIFMEKKQVAGRYFSNGQETESKLSWYFRDNHAQTTNNNNPTLLFCAAIAANPIYKRRFGII